jgi:hypothetical protein
MVIGLAELDLLNPTHETRPNPPRPAKTWVRLGILKTRPDTRFNKSILVQLGVCLPGHVLLLCTKSLNYAEAATPLGAFAPMGTEGHVIRR